MIVRRRTPGEAVRIATRGSELALRQARMVQLELSARGVTSELKTFSTVGDKKLDVPLASIGGKGLFTQELEDALAKGTVDCCVHSLKDLPTEAPDGLPVLAVLEREHRAMRWSSTPTCRPRRWARSRAARGSGRRACDAARSSSRCAPTSRSSSCAATSRHACERWRTGRCTPRSSPRPDPSPEREAEHRDVPRRTRVAPRGRSGRDRGAGARQRRGAWRRASLAQPRGDRDRGERRACVPRRVRRRVPVADRRARGRGPMAGRCTASSPTCEGR